MTPPPDDLALAHRLADLADAMTRTAFTGSGLAFATKSDGSPVTETDVAVERAVREMLAEVRPRDAVLGEEIGAVGAGRRRWLLDGIDGTVNFVAGAPSWATEIALVVDDEVVLGVSTSPGLGRRWWGGAGLGAWVADLPVATAAPARRLGVARAGRGYATMPGAERWHDETEERWLAPLAQLGEEVASPLHSALLVAGGDVAACLHARGGPWDFAAFAAIVEGAGGRWSDLRGGKRLDHGGPVLYSNGVVHARVLAALAEG